MNISVEKKFKIEFSPVGCDGIVSSLDPLSLDYFFKNNFHRLNQTENTTELIKITQTAVLRSKRIDLNKYTAMAITRDLGFLASALTKHNIKIQEVFGLEEELSRMVFFTLEVPRDNVNSYATRNPQGDRQRSYTGLQEENLFIDSVRKAMVCLPKVVENLLALKVVSIDDGAFINLLDKATGYFKDIIDSIIKVKKCLTRVLFFPTSSLLSCTRNKRKELFWTRWSSNHYVVG